MSFQFNENQIKLIKEYRKLLIYGYKKISNVELDLKKVRVRKKILYFLMGAMQSYSESLFKLMSSKPAYEKPGESLLRSQIEILLNIRFIYSSRSENKARLFLSDLIIDSISFAKKHKDLWHKYPEWNMSFASINQIKEWDEFISKNLKELEDYQKKYKDKRVKQLPNLYDKTLAIDKYLKKIGNFSEDNSAEKFYVLYYKYLSQSSHLNMSGLQRFIRSKDNLSQEPFFDIDSKPEDVEKVIAVSYQIYFLTLKLFLQIFKNYSKLEYEQFKKYSKIISNKKNRSK